MPAGRRIRWGRMVSAFPLVLLLFVAAVLTWLANDTQRVRRTIEGIVSAIADRPFSIEGEFDYELGRIVTVHAGKIRWRNSASNASPYMLEVEQFTGSFDLLSLFDWPLVITRVQARHATLLFEWDNQDGFNWRLGSIDTTRPKSSAPPDPLPLVIDQASVQDVSLRFRHPALTEELEVLVRQAQHQQDHAHRLVVSAVARLEDRDLSIGAFIGPFPELAVAGAIDFDVVVAGRLAILAAAGKFARLAQLQGPELVAELKAPSATDLAKRLKFRWKRWAGYNSMPTSVPRARAWWPLPAGPSASSRWTRDFVVRARNHSKGWMWPCDPPGRASATLPPSPVCRVYPTHLMHSTLAPSIPTGASNFSAFSWIQRG
jgi:hypothetical protein